MESQQAHRKNEHLSIAEKYYQTAHSVNPFEELRIIHQSLPEISIDDVTLSSMLTDSITSETPFYIEAMTGGSQQAKKINRQLAQMAALHQLPMACGSQSIALKDPDAIDSFSVIREENPNGIVIANLSAGASVSQVKEAVNMINANAVELHVNAAQEIIMPEGERSFDWVNQISEIVSHVDIPVIVKEVGFGMSHETIQQLVDVGVKNINVSGRGGTNFAMIENRRNHDLDFSSLASWGQTALESLLESRHFQSQINVIAGGGITSPLDVIKCGVLGAQNVGIAGYFLNILNTDGLDALSTEISNFKLEIKRILLLCGCHDFSELSKCSYVLSSNLKNYVDQRNI